MITTVFTWEQTLAELMGFVGREVMVMASPHDPDGDAEVLTAPMLNVTGTLERGTPSKAHAVIVALGQAVPGDDAITFTISGGTLLTLTRARLKEAGRSGVGSAIYVVQDGVMIQVSDVQEARMLAEHINTAM